MRRAIARIDIGRCCRHLACWGPGLLVMLADTDAGNVVTAAQGASLWGYAQLPLWLLLALPLYMVQELTVRLGIFSGRGYTELVRERFGAYWAWIASGGLVIAVLSTLVTEFTAVAAIGELYGLSRTLTLTASCALLVLIASARGHRRVERIAIAAGLCELCFFMVAGYAHPDHAIMLRHAAHIPFADSGFLLISAAIIGATFNPWMVFYQQSSIAAKRLGPEHYRAARWETAFGAVLAQALCGAILVAVAASRAHAGAPHGALASIGEIYLALAPLLGHAGGKLIFSVGILGSAAVAAMVASLALRWGIDEATRSPRATAGSVSNGWRFRGLYMAGTVGSAWLVWRAPDLVWLNITAQVVNALLLPLALGMLAILASTALAPEQRLRGAYRIVVIGLICAICLVGWVGGLAQ